MKKKLVEEASYQTLIVGGIAHGKKPLYPCFPETTNKPKECFKDPYSPKDTYGT
jgi:hypothetical protein